MDRNSFSILITGDLVINQEYWVSNLDQGLIDLFHQSDLNIVNLEAPVTKSSSRILKTGPHLKSEKQSTLDVLKQLEVDVVTLANNHVLDYDEQGVMDTLSFCTDNNIQTVGAGKNLEESSKTLYIHSTEGSIAIVNFAENEWSSATDESAGANPMDIIENAKQIQEAKQKADFVFVIVHGGHEYYNLPSPRTQKQYRFYAEQGADIVIGHHTHCISGHETHQGVPIYYSLGNFLFTKTSSYEDWYLGLILEVEIKNSKLIHKLHPVKQEKEGFELILLDGVEKEEVLNRISGYNVIIKDSEKLKIEWSIYMESMYAAYLNYWTPLSFIKNRYIKGLFNKLGIRLLNEKGMTYYLNLIRCEAHNDMSKEVIQKYLKNKKSQT
ncbi:CapA family protein [Winogradskyella sp.]|uniref:CapA family protein n=1 Tax=Winogradskyella sp. TaxID=1883156 RepID=UPI003AB71AE9